MNIRKMAINDYDEIYALWLLCAGMGLNNLGDSRDGIGKFLKRNPDTCFVAESDHQIVGTIIAGNDGRRGYIYHTAVNPQYRKRGVARQLVETSVQAFKQCGINKVALVVFDRNENGPMQGFATNNPAKMPLSFALVYVIMDSHFDRYWNPPKTPGPQRLRQCSAPHKNRQNLLFWAS